VNAKPPRERASQREPFYPLDPDEVAEEFGVLMPGRNHKPGTTFTNIIGLKLKGGATRYRCRFCADKMWLGWGAVRQHLGREHPGPKTEARRRRIADAAAVGLEPAPDDVAPSPVEKPKRRRTKSTAEAAEENDTYVSQLATDGQAELELGVAPLANGRSPARRAMSPAQREAALDKMAPHIGTSVSELLDWLLESRTQLKADLGEVLEEKAQLKAERDEALKILRQAVKAASKLFEGMEV